jgi:hypothetical protein
MAEVLALEHADRRQWVAEIDRINQRRNEEDERRVEALRRR